MRRLERIGYWGMAVLLVAVLFVVLLAARGEGGSAETDGVALWRGGWVAEANRAVTLPRALGGGEVALKRTLPEDIPEGTVVYVNANYQRVRAFLDETELPVRGLRADTLVPLPNGCPWTALALPAEAAGRTLTLSFSGTGSKTRVEVYRVLAGPESAIRFRLLNGALPALAVCAFTVLMAAVLLVFALLLRLRGAASDWGRLLLLAAFSLLSAGWMFTDCDIQGVYYIGSEAFFLANLLSYMLMPLPFLLMVRSARGPRLRAVDIGVWLLFAEIALNLFWLLSGRYRLDWTLSVSHVALGLAIALALFQCLYDRRSEKNAASWGTFASLLALGLTGLAAIGRFYLLPSPDNTMLFRYGIVFFIAVLGLDAVRGGLHLLERARNYEELRIREEEYRIAAEHSGKMILRYDIRTGVSYQQSSATTEFSLPAVLTDVPESVLKRDVVAAESAEEYRRVFREIRAGRALGGAIVRLRRWTGEARWYRLDYTTVFAETGEPLQAIVSLYDVTDRREKELAFEKWQQNYDALPRDRINYYECNLSKDVFEREEGSLLPSVGRRASATMSDVARHTAERYAYPEDRERFLEFYARERLLACYDQGVRAERMEFRRQDAQGRPLWTAASVQLIPDPYSTDVKCFMLLQDVDAEKRAELLASARQNLDPLTALLNRGAFIERVAKLLNAARPGDCHALVMIDIDGFKQVNDTLGHMAGDETLRRIADCLRGMLGEDDLLGRIGGDEFIACLRDARTGLAPRLEAICLALRDTAAPAVPVSGSLGVALFPADGRAFDELYQKADKALYQAKRQGKSQFVIYSAALEEETHGSLGTPIDDMSGGEERGGEAGRAP